MQLQKKYNEWRQWLEKEWKDTKFNFYDPSTKEIQAFSEYAGLNKEPTKSEMLTLEHNYLKEILGEEKIQELINRGWYAQYIYEGISRNIDFEIKHGIADRTKELSYAVQRYCDEHTVSGNFLKEQLEQYRQTVKEREEAFIDGIELKMDMGEPILDEDYATYKEYINNRASREAEQKKEEAPLEEPKKEAERKPRMMGKAR